MVYTAALILGHGMPVLSEEESVVDMMRKFLFQRTSGEKRSSGGRRGSVDSCDEMEKSFQSKLFALENYVESSSISNERLFEKLQQYFVI